MVVTTLDGYSQTKAAERIGVSHETVRRYGNAGKLGYIITPIGRVYQTADVERIARERAVKEGRNDG